MLIRISDNVSFDELQNRLLSVGFQLKRVRMVLMPELDDNDCFVADDIQTTQEAACFTSDLLAPESPSSNGLQINPETFSRFTGFDCWEQIAKSLGNCPNCYRADGLRLNHDLRGGQFAICCDCGYCPGDRFVSVREAVNAFNGV